MIKIPQGNWKKANQSDVLGSLWSEFNLDPVENLGATRVSPRTLITTDNLTDLGTSCAFVNYTDVFNNATYLWAVSGKYVWVLNTASANGYVGAFAKDSTVAAHTGTPTGVDDNTSCADDVSDMVIFGGNGQVNSLLFITTKQKLYYFDGFAAGIWASRAEALVGSTSHMLCVFANRIYVTDSNKLIRSAAITIGEPSTVGAINTSGSNYLDLSVGGRPMSAITDIIAVTDGIWIFTINGTSDGCWVHKWDGVTTNVTTPYEIKDTTGILACLVIGNTPWVIDNNGVLRYFNGGAFVEAPKGKLPVKQAKNLVNSRASTNTRWIHPNGIDVVDGRINILVNNENSDNGATIEENLPSGIWEYDAEIGWYHKYSLSLYLQSGGSVTDYGQNRLAGVGAIFAKKRASTGSTADGTMLIGAKYYSNATTTRYGIWLNNSLDTIQKYGYFVTTKIFSPNIKEAWQKVYLRMKKLLDSSDSITVKYRTSDVAPLEGTITWIDSNSFTTTAAVSGYVVGDEVEILQGTGSGKCAHISTIQAADASSYIVNLDDTFTGVTTGTAKARFQKWKKVGINQTSQTEDVFEFPLGANSVWIQIKVCLQFTGKDEINDLILENTKHK